VALIFRASTKRLIQLIDLAKQKNTLVSPSQWPTNSCDDLLQSAFQIVRILAPRERTDRNVISVRISERELLGLSVRIHVWLLFEPSDERACPLKRQVEIIDTEEQQEAVAGYPVVGAHQ